MSRFLVVFTILAKEIKESCRDRRSLIGILILPLLGPILIAFVLDDLIQSFDVPSTVEIPIKGVENAPHLVSWLAQQRVIIIPVEGDVRAQVANGKLDFAVVLAPTYANDFKQLSSATVQIITDSSRNDVFPAVRSAQLLLHSYNQIISNLRLIARGVSPEIIKPFNIEQVDVSSRSKLAAKIVSFIPIFILVAAFATGMQIAIDSTAGERERNSFEALLVNPISRFEIIVGKWLAALTFSSFGSMTALLCSILMMYILPVEQLGISFSLSLANILILLLYMIPLSMVATSFQILASIFALSYKEAQFYLTILLMVPVLPSLMSAMYGFEGSFWISTLPAIGQFFQLREVFSGGGIQWGLFIVSSVSSVIVAMISVYLASCLLKNERIVFGRSK